MSASPQMAPTVLTNRIPSRRGRKPGKRSYRTDMKVKLERSRQSARECRARKKLRYQYLDDLAVNIENRVLALRKEKELMLKWSEMLDKSEIPPGFLDMVEKYERTGGFNDSKTATDADDTFALSPDEENLLQEE